MNLSPRQNAWLAAHSEFNLIGMIGDYAYVCTDECENVIELSFSTTYKEVIQNLESITSNVGFKPSQWFIDWQEKQNTLDTAKLVRGLDDVHYRVKFDFVGQSFTFYFAERNDAHTFIDSLCEFESQVNQCTTYVDFSQTFHIIGDEQVDTLDSAMARVRMAYAYYNFINNPSAYHYSDLTTAMQSYQLFVYPD